MSVCLSVSMMLTFSKPRGSTTAGQMSMKFGVYSVGRGLGVQNFWEVEFWISTQAPYGRDDPHRQGCLLCQQIVCSYAMYSMCNLSR